MSMTTFQSLGGIVMIPLLMLSLVTVALILERILFWSQVNRRQKPFVREVLNLYRQNPHQAFQHLHQNVDLPIARIFLAALELDRATPDEFRLALESAAQAEIPLLKRFNTVFETVITVSPLLGLLGTILGLINAFGSLQIGDIGGTQTTGVTSGISEALVSTAGGIVVAIFTLLFANAFRSMYLRQIALIQEYGGQLELMYRRYYEQFYRRANPPYASPQ
jgi:biopolymer transport protein ExbB